MRALIIALAFSTALVSQGLYPQSTLQCGTAKDPFSTGYPRSARESAALRTAPNDAYRPGKYALVVRWRRGTRLFRDRPPYAAELDGVHWAYCGFDPTVKMHLIGKIDADVFTGELLDDGSGAILPAGETVVFSPSRKYYLAYEQPDGQDGPTLKLYDNEGNQLWKGFDGLLSKDGMYVIADFDRVSWTADDKLAAEYEQANKLHRLVLIRNSAGHWNWQE